MNYFIWHCDCHRLKQKIFSINQQNKLALNLSLIFADLQKPGLKGKTPTKLRGGKIV